MKDDSLVAPGHEDGAFLFAIGVVGCMIFVLFAMALHRAGIYF